MDWQKELTDCNNWILEQDDDFVTGYGQGNYALGLARLAWQAAKAQSVPEDFILVKKDDLDFLRDLAVQAKYASLNNDSDRIFSDIEGIQLSVERLLEPQEPK